MTAPFDGNKTTRIRDAAIKLHEIPPEKWRTTARKAVLGTLFIVLGVVGAAKWSWPVYVVIGVCVFGANIISSQIIAASVKNLIPLLKAVADIVRGKPDA